jgi:hypothetical protein
VWETSDLTELSFMDSAGVGVLMRINDAVGDTERLRLVNGLPAVERVLDVAGVRSRLPIITKTSNPLAPLWRWRVRPRVSQSSVRRLLREHERFELDVRLERIIAQQRDHGAAREVLNAGDQVCSHDALERRALLSTRSLLPSAMSARSACVSVPRRTTEISSSFR